MYLTGFFGLSLHPEHKRKVEGHLTLDTTLRKDYSFTIFHKKN